MGEVEEYLIKLKELSQYIIYDNIGDDIKKLDKMIDKAKKGKINKLLKKKDDENEE